MKSHLSTSYRGTEAVKRMRQQKLRDGQPFMINVRELPADQCYLEYPDGSISQVAVVSAKRDFRIIRKLSISETGALRRRFQLGN